MAEAEQPKTDGLGQQNVAKPGASAGGRKQSPAAAKKPRSKVRQKKRKKKSTWYMHPGFEPVAGLLIALFITAFFLFNFGDLLGVDSRGLIKSILQVSGTPAVIRGTPVPAGGQTPQVISTPRAGATVVPGAVPSPTGKPASGATPTPGKN